MECAEQQRSFHIKAGCTAQGAPGTSAETASLLVYRTEAIGSSVVVALAELENLQQAHELIRAGLRLSIIRGMTRIGTRTLRQWWKDVHGVKPSNGKLPETVLSFIKDRDSAARLSAFAALHQRLFASDLTTTSLMTTWQEYQRICGPLDINAAYFAARDVRVKIVMLVPCQVCNAAFIYDAGSKHTDHCPFCETRVVVAD